MKSSARWLSALLLGSALVGSIDAVGDEDSSTTPRRPELEYFKAVNRAGPPRDPQLLFLLMAQYANANRHREGITFLSSLLKEFGPQLSNQQKSLYLAAIGLLRAEYAGEVTFWKRIGWVKDTIAILEEAKRLSGGEIFPVRWISGLAMPSFLRSSNRGKRLWLSLPGALRTLISHPTVDG